MKKNSFGQGLAIFLVIIGVLFVIGSIGEASELSALSQDVIISRQVEAVIVICINHILEAVNHIAVLHVAINRLEVLLRVV